MYMRSRSLRAFPVPVPARCTESGTGTEPKWLHFRPSARFVPHRFLIGLVGCCFSRKTLSTLRDGWVVPSLIECEQKTRGSPSRKMRTLRPRPAAPCRGTGFPRYGWRSTSAAREETTTIVKRERYRFSCPSTSRNCCSVQSAVGWEMMWPGRIAIRRHSHGAVPSRAGASAIRSLSLARRIRISTALAVMPSCAPACWCVRPVITTRRSGSL